MPCKNQAWRYYFYVIFHSFLIFHSNFSTAFIHGLLVPDLSSAHPLSKRSFLINQFFAKTSFGTYLQFYCVTMSRLHSFSVFAFRRISDRMYRPENMETWYILLLVSKPSSILLTRLPKKRNLALMFFSNMNLQVRCRQLNATKKSSTSFYCLKMAKMSLT